MHKSHEQHDKIYRSPRKSCQLIIHLTGHYLHPLTTFQQRIVQFISNACWTLIPEERYYLPSEAETSRRIMVDGNVPIEMIKDITRVIVTSENAKRLQEYMTILDKPADFRGTAIRL